MCEFTIHGVNLQSITERKKKRKKKCFIYQENDEMYLCSNARKTQG